MKYLLIVFYFIFLCFGCIVKKESILRNDEKALFNERAKYYKSGDYRKSLEIDIQLADISAKIYGKDSEEYITMLGVVASDHSVLGDHAKSLEINLLALSLAEIHLSKNNGIYALALQRLAFSYDNFGKYKKALELEKQSLKITKKVYGDFSGRYHTILNNLAGTYLSLGNYNKSLELHKEGVILAEKVYGKKSERYFLALSALSASHLKLKDYNKALELQLKVIELTKEKFGDKSHFYKSHLNGVSLCYSKLKNHSKAKEIALELLKLTRYFDGEDHLSYALALNNLGKEYVYLNELDSALSCLSEKQEIQIMNIKYFEKSLNNSLRNHIYNDILTGYQELFHISKHLNNSEEIKNQYNTLCLLKGRELSKNNSISSYIHLSNDDELIKLYEAWIAVNKNICFSYEKTLNQREKLGLDLEKLQDKADNLERQLTEGSSIFSSIHREYSFEDVVSNLKKDELYLDIVNIKRFYSDANTYYTYVIKKGDTIPELVNLGSASSLDNIYREYSNYTKKRPSRNEFSHGDEHDGNICYQNFWSKLEPYLEGISTVYFSPEGVYSKINPNVLYDSTASSFLMDKYDIVYVSNVEDFVHQKENIQLYERPDDLHAVLIGNPTFLLGEGKVVLATNEIQSKAINQDELDSLQRGVSLRPLPGTQKEIDLIYKILKSKGWDVDTFSGVNATETRVKSIGAPKILHIATHGFFFEDQEMVDSTNMISTDNKKAVANPMTRSGLVFAGAQNTSDREILANDNGWLNSYEASLLNLRGTELVVLSACETGLGDIQNGKGVYGLQRAIRVAGAESLIMCMWKVNDKVTQELMTYFYDYWIDKNMTKKEAFKEAQQKIREKYKHPYYWGAFIMLGE